MDITGKIGPLYPIPESEWPMYSFNGPAFSFWNGVAKGLKDSNYNEKDIQGWLQSKSARWFLDYYGEKIESLGFKLILEDLK